MLLSVVLPLLFLLIFVPVILVLYGITRWQTETSRIRDQLEGTRERLPARIFEAHELEDLPAPVRRFLQTALPPGQPLIAVAELGQTGRVNLAATGERWAPFAATQVAVTQRPGFDWDARIRRAPGIQAFVRDAYIAGAGRLQASLLGLTRAAERQDRGRLAEAELMRFLAEAAWYPTKLLPSQGTRWEPIDDESARATLVDGDSQATLTFDFDEGGMIRAVRAAGRWRDDAGQLVETPWEVRFWGYETRTGIRIPTQAEAAWLLASGRHPYWQGQITDTLYKFAP